MQPLLDLFSDVFEEPESYSGNRPDPAYLHALLSNPHFIALCAIEDDVVIGGLAAYELPKFEQPRSEILIYDLAVTETHRRHGIATALIQRVQEIASQRRAWVVFIQADQNDEAPIALYSKLGKRETIESFTIDVNPGSE
ncbi:MAG: GNAT family N-acetyltransferase [Pseudomonadota bacterium]